MTPEESIKIGEYLEHQGFSDNQIDDYLEHFGVKGMRWGVVKTTTSSGRTFTRRSNLQRGTIAVSALASGNVVTNAIIKKLGAENRATVPLAIAGGSAAAILGGRAARTIVDKSNKVPTKQLGGKHLGDKDLSPGEKAYTVMQGASIAIVVLGGAAAASLAART